MTTLRIWIAIALFAALWTAARSNAATVYAANDGKDGATCGTEQAPCRSLSAAIARASDGDIVEVGPGRYGDLDGNGLLGNTAGEEEVDLLDCACLVEVGKRVAVLSRDGAAATQISVPPIPETIAVVRLSAAGSAFGARNRGFTILAGSKDGILASGSGVSIAGNFVLYAGVGIFATGPDAVVSDNRVLQSVTGFRLDGPGCRAERNAALRNEGQGFTVAGEGCVLDSSAAIANLIGLTFSAANGALRSSTIAGNRKYGADVTNASTRVEGSRFYGNGAEEHGIEPNCGLLGAHGLDASGNYWGGAFGPGGDPGDAICSPDIVFEPFVSKDTPLALKPIR